MSKKEKNLRKLLENPSSVSYRQIENILLHMGFSRSHLGTSHVKFRHIKVPKNISIPVHNGDCKLEYKRQVSKILTTYFF